GRGTVPPGHRLRDRGGQGRYLRHRGDAGRLRRAGVLAQAPAPGLGRAGPGRVVGVPGGRAERRDGGEWGPGRRDRGHLHRRHQQHRARDGRERPAPAAGDNVDGRALLRA
ncbi:MAG: hypothetical protein AVDCRST_MAG05-651, partial [uncultured Rubrobacteraceae bacterium]